MSGGADGNNGPGGLGFFHRAIGVWTIVGSVCAVLSVVIALIAIKLGTANSADGSGMTSGGLVPTHSSSAPTATEAPTTEEPTEDPTTQEPTEEPVEDPTTDEPTEDPTPTPSRIPLLYRSNGTSYFDCDSEGRIASKLGGSVIEWRVRNESSVRLHVYYLGTDGLRRNEQTLEPGGYLNFTTMHTGHIYLFARTNASCSKIIRVDDDSTWARTTIVDND
ncbi:PT domain-containing protein [Streptomyces sp. Q6]|uniref:PT domain-containing protein n=1 Tax=Streptomyces citrinus TaxID=3118173 RepID=A0ACD5ALZ9_9ACTN